MLEIDGDEILQLSGEEDRKCSADDWRYNERGDIGIPDLMNLVMTSWVYKKETDVYLSTIINMMHIIFIV